MGQFPQLVEEDIRKIDGALDDLLRKSEAQALLFVEKAGYLITQRGKVDQIDTTEIATLSANAFAATQFMADRLQEPRFTSMYQQGDNTSVLWLNIDENSLLIALFPASLSVGLIRFYATTTVRTIADQLAAAAQRAPGTGIDFADVNPDDINILFQKKEA